MKKTLTFDECKTLMLVIAARGSMRSRESDRALVIGLLLCGNAARCWTWQDVFEQALDLPNAVYDAVRRVAISKRLTLIPVNHAGFQSAHWVRGTKLEHAVFTVGRTPLTTQEVTRRLKRYARIAGISPARMSLRTVANTHHDLLNLFGDADSAALALGLDAGTRTPSAGQLPAVKWNPVMTGTRVERDPRLHGVGRRSAAALKTA
jgi:hypothetical protein